MSKENKKSKFKKDVRESIKILDQIVEKNKKDKKCHIKLTDDTSKIQKDNEKCCQKNDNKSCECAENDCAECIQASREICDAPTITKLLTTVFTAIPHFKISESNTLVNLTGNTFTLQDFNYYVKLPEKGIDEIRLLLPCVWMINALINKLRNKFSGTGAVSLTFNLNVLAEQQLIKDPAQNVLILNTNNPINNLCACDVQPVAIWAYTFRFIVNNGLLTNAVVTLIIPNNPDFLDILVTPSAGTVLMPNNFDLFLESTATTSVDNSAIIIASIMSLLGAVVFPVIFPVSLAGFTISQLNSLNALLSSLSNTLVNLTPSQSIQEVALSADGTNVVVLISGGGKPPTEIFIPSILSGGTTISTPIFSPAHSKSSKKCIFF
jgi:hypothetical protein